MKTLIGQLLVAGAVCVVGAAALLLTVGIGGTPCSPPPKIAEIVVRETMSTPLLAFKAGVGEYPTTEQGLPALLIEPPGVTGWRGPYVKEVPLDPWNRDYRYRSPGVRNPDGYDLWSVGPDGLDGMADDIGNWIQGRGSPAAARE